MSCGFCRSARDETMLIVVESVALIGVPFESAEDDFFKDFSENVYYTFWAEIAKVGVVAFVLLRNYMNLICVSPATGQ
jgi:hypothetical protein